MSSNYFLFIFNQLCIKLAPVRQNDTKQTVKEAGILRNSAVGLFFGAGSVAVAELRKAFGKVELVRMAETEWDAVRLADAIDKKAFLSDKVKEALSKAGIPPGSVVAGFSSEGLTVRSFEIPFLPKNERRDAVRFEAHKYISFETQEIYTAFDIFPEKEFKRIQVLFLASKKSVIDAQKIVLEQAAGLKLLALEPDFVSLWRALSYGAPKDSQVGLYLYLRKNGLATVCVVRSGFILLFRDFSVSATEGKAAKPDVEMLLAELRLTLNYFSRQFKEETARRIFISFDAGADFSGWEETLKNELSIETRVLKMAELFGKQSSFSPALGTAVGLALRQIEGWDRDRLNFLTDLMEKQQERAAASSVVNENVLIQKRAVPALLAAAGVVLLLHVGLSMVTSQLRVGLPKTLSLAELKNQEASLQEKKNYFQNLSKKRVFLTDKLSQIGKVAPDTVSLAALDYKGEVSDVGLPRTTLRLEWESSSADPGRALLDANNFVNGLREDAVFSPGFAESKVNSSNRGAAPYFTADFLPPAVVRK